MNTQNLIGCWIDGAIPRTPKERAFKLRDLLVTLDPEYTDYWLGIFDLEAMNFDDPDSEDIHWINDDLIDHISAVLPDGLELITEAGDVIITTAQEARI